VDFKFQGARPHGLFDSAIYGHPQARRQWLGLLHTRRALRVPRMLLLQPPAVLPVGVLVVPRDVRRRWRSGQSLEQRFTEVQSRLPRSFAASAASAGLSSTSRKATCASAKDGFPRTTDCHTRMAAPTYLHQAGPCVLAFFCPVVFHVSHPIKKVRVRSTV